MMFFGAGVLRGMLVTLKNFVTSYFMGPNSGGLFTVEYPEKRIAEKENSRSIPFIVYDETPENPRCTACDICARECPPKCILVVRDADKDGKPLRRPAVFDVDLSVCMGCGICEEVCPFDSIYMDHRFEISQIDGRGNLRYHKNDLLKPREYFSKIRPTDAGAIDRRRRETEEKKKAAVKTVGQPPETKKTE